MIMSDAVSNVLDQLSTLFQQIETVLNEWEGEGNLQFPSLMTMMATKFNWSEKQAREVDPIIRYYVRNSDNWHVTRGAKGGIMRASDRRKKQEAAAAKDSLKKQMRERIEAKTMPISASIDEQSSDDESLADDSED